jgi:hypothetical protein
VARVVFTEELIRTFYDKISLTYPDLPLETIDKICRAEFRMMKDSMTDGKLEDFRLQYLFNIRVSPQKIIKQLHFMYKEREGIRPEKYEHYMEMILNHIKNNNNKFDRYYERIRKYTGYTRGQISRGEYANNGH